MENTKLNLTEIGSQADDRAKDRPFPPGCQLPDQLTPREKELLAAAVPWQRDPPQKTPAARSIENF